VISIWIITAELLLEPHPYEVAKVAELKEQKGQSIMPVQAQPVYFDWPRNAMSSGTGICYFKAVADAPSLKHLKRNLFLACSHTRHTL
jgi:hypothetical protein